MPHTCDAVVVTCIDFRFQKYIRKWTDEHLKGKTFDLVGFAGSTKDLQTIIGQIDISVRLHHVKRVVLIHHENCGAYGSESTKEKHSLELVKAETAIGKKYPKLKINLYYLKLDGKFEKID